MFTVYYTTSSTGSAKAIIETANLREFIYTILHSGGSIDKIEKM